MKKLVVKEENCKGCRFCELACSSYKKGSYNPKNSRIIAIRYDYPERTRLAYCRQCDNAACAEVCPVQAIELDTRINAYIVDEEKCIGCGMCVEACPFDAIFIDKETEKAVKCDLCGGDPQCVKFCPKDTLFYE
jgi:carbon-monoxide dehydrogenase iron sulfur subunit